MHNFRFIDDSSFVLDFRTRYANSLFWRATGCTVNKILGSKTVVIAIEANLVYFFKANIIGIDTARIAEDCAFEDKTKEIRGSPFDKWMYAYYS